MIEPAGYLTVGLFTLGMAASFLAADPRSPTSRSLALLWALLGVAALMNLPATASGSRVLWQRLYSLIDPACIICAAEWIRRIGRTEVGAGPSAGAGERLLRVAQGCAVIYGLVGLLLPEARGEVWGAGDLSKPEFYLFAVPFAAAGLLGGMRLVQLLNADVDRAEKARLLAALVALPIWGMAMFASDRWRPVISAAGAVVFLVGAIRFHVVQGKRSQFLARFLSPQVTRLVRDRGLVATMQRSRVELSVVACDLRGFTAFAETAAPEDVMKLLEEYYGAVGQVVSELGGSIKDLTGDGVLALVGAPIALPDHASRAVRIALRIRERAQAVLDRWRTLGFDLGLGIGVASGFATVGTIGGADRLEYAAVGPAVNLAARLCNRAESRQVLAEPRVVGLALQADARYRFEPLGTAVLKGFARPVAIFATESTVHSAEAACPSSRSSGGT